ncbi:MAG TPA: hypothetical protein VM577_04400 [Anaerovoracaceae bacterium]|nr:hypothetical protein [Anaerovoracaceae bacterium]
MAGFSKYPGQIDDSSTLPVSTDNVTPVKAEVVNRLRDAVLAIESELGIDPSREFGTVRARLDAMSSGGGGGGGGAIEILENGVEILPSAISLNFTGAVNVTQTSPLHAKIEVVGGQATQIQENHTAAFNGQTLYTLAQTPIQAAAVMLFINGVKQQQGTEYSVAGTILTYFGSYSILTTDKLELFYMVDLGGVGAQLAVQKEGVDVDIATIRMNFVGAINATSDGFGHVTVSIAVPPKIRVFRNTTLAGSAVNVSKTVTWNSVSTHVTTSLASQTGTNTQLTTSSSGNFFCSGQLAIQPTLDAVAGVTIEVLLNGGTVVETVNDYGAVWGAGITRTISFGFPIDLTAGDTLEVRWTHLGSAPSTTQLMSGDNLSWFAISGQ